MAIRPEFIINLRGRDYPLFAGLLDAATQAGLQSLVTTIIQLPTPENQNMAVVMARAEFEDGRVFEDVGDASPANVANPQIATAVLRLASTRAKGRALRDAVNCGATMFEELPDLAGDPEPQPSPEPKPSNGNGHPTCEECGLRLTAGQATFSVKHYSKPLCSDHQKAVHR